MKLTPMKRATAIAGGSLLFFLLGRFAVIPSPVPTVNLCLQYGLLAFWSVAFGPMAGGLAGLLGHICIDLTFGELCWSWILATAAFGALTGVLANITRIDPKGLTREDLIRFNLIQIAVHVVCWAGIAPVLEIVIYSESMDLIFAQGLTAAIANTVTTAIVGSGLLLAAKYFVFPEKSA